MHDAARPSAPTQHQARPDTVRTLDGQRVDCVYPCELIDGRRMLPVMQPGGVAPALGHVPCPTCEAGFAPCGEAARAYLAPLVAAFRSEAA